MGICSLLFNGSVCMCHAHLDSMCFTHPYSAHFWLLYCLWFWVLFLGQLTVSLEAVFQLCNSSDYFTDVSSHFTGLCPSMCSVLCSPRFWSLMCTLVPQRTLCGLLPSLFTFQGIEMTVFFKKSQEGTIVADNVAALLRSHCVEEGAVYDGSMAINFFITLN